jgi:CcmD family protein
MTMLRRVFITFGSILLLAVPLLAGQPPSAAQEGFVPIDQLPPGEQLPAAPLLIAAYAFVWVATVFYLWTIWQRLGKVEADMQALERRTSSGNASR